MCQLWIAIAATQLAGVYTMAELELPEDLMGICTQQLLSDVTLPEHSGDDELEALVSKADLAVIDSIASASAGAEPHTN